MVEVVVADTPAQVAQCFEIRKEVFVAEQNVPIAEEIDAFDEAPSTVHLLAITAGNALGTIRILPDQPGQVHIGRVAVRAQARGMGIGSMLMEAGQKYALQHFADSRGQVVVKISAQLQALGFYAALGYELTDGAIYYDAGIEHRDMIWRSAS
ncbi:GNAT family N-acetyltransferase [Arcanobacterium hippocoleae]|uniref:GNAT family N-acyltransferase n=1 Tax=Arcanobacterium hippocoleae TaxID=149017 RepID=A0ABU1T0U5_9ACTO|nr:GNAT family N-acetyltransferase [Arcanobacterium hippocoleae]MDR6938992.1 putative GNAT family N-acyltransferase [Arcanobacterium hippocoleae]